MHVSCRSLNVNMLFIKCLHDPDITFDINAINETSLHSESNL